MKMPAAGASYCNTCGETASEDVLAICDACGDESCGKCADVDGIHHDCAQGDEA